MIRNIKVIFLVILTIFLSQSAFALAPVVDDSENYALLEQQAMPDRPAVHEEMQDNQQLSYNETEHPLAQDNGNDEIVTDNLDADAKIKELRQDVQDLRGQLEVLTHELKVLKEQQLAFYKDLDARLANPNAIFNNQAPVSTNQDQRTQHPIQAAAPESKSNSFFDKSPAMSHVSSANTNPADEQISYLAAYELVKNKQYSAGLTAMQKFLAKYPNGFYSANAEYWTGEMYLDSKNYKDAISHFNAVLQQFPTSNKYSASMLKMSFALADSGKKMEATQYLQEVLKKYPDTKVSELAQIKLEEINRSL
ncbi:MAG: tol-pal system protein YbgF [Legionellales bacterium RIFCSPHIGHO2_12_FULL_35_11]|nr:MAG: tol-pal system protein YbgF [Legionellales bacterium RIFCSPHIGHO2_12_FULL_35_11]